MVKLITASICLNDIPQFKYKKDKNGNTYINFTISEMRQPDKWGNTHTLYLSQGKEERENKVEKVYIGKGKEWKQNPQPQQGRPKLPIEGKDDFPADLGFDL